MPGWLKTHARYRSQLDDVDWDASSLWHALGLYCTDVGNDGLVPWSKLHAAVGRKISVKRVEAAALILLAEDLFVDKTVGGVRHVMRCDWEQDQPKAEVWTDPVEHERMLRRKQLHRDAHLCEQVRNRDRNLCRYCGVRVDWKDRKGPTGGTYDHIDPDGPNTLKNVAVACRHCNGVKRDRTPEQAGMPLREPGDSRPAAAASASPRGADRSSRSGRKSGPDLAGLDPDLASRVNHTRDVTYLAGSDFGSSRARSEHAGSRQNEPGQIRSSASPPPTESTGGAQCR